MSEQRNFRFFMSLEDDTEVEWRTLTSSEARRMYTITHAHTPRNVVSYGWEMCGVRHIDEDEQHAA